MTLRSRKWLPLAAGLLLAAVVALSLLRPGPDGAPTTFADFVGDSTCLSCHQDKAAFEGTAHRLTSRPATAATIAGSFAPDSSRRSTANPSLHYRMEATPRGFLQSAVWSGRGDSVIRSERFDIVVGSNRKGQTYLSWRDGGQLFQLPVSYWTELGSWVNSPGYQDGVMNFDRPIPPRCLECHATYLDADESEGLARYEPETALLGISCEKCHGAGREHVGNERSAMPALLRSAVVHPGRLPRTRQVDGCALCHAGIGEPVQKPFTYRPGEPLERYLHLPQPLPDEQIDVHGNTVGLLARSACFQSSDMTCSTCHDVHRTQRDAASFSSRCLTCHTPPSCGLFPELGARIAENCVDCHMPNLPSATIVSSVDGQAARPHIRSHWIKVYPDRDSL